MANSSNWIQYPSTALYISDGYDSTSSTADNFISLGGDTMRFYKQRIPDNSGSIGSGYPGEFCFGVDAGVTYLYYCVAPNQWQRSAFSTY